MKNNSIKAYPNSIFRSIEANLDGIQYLSDDSKVPPRFKNHSSQSWSPPPQNFWKLNTDATWSEEKGIGGLGWIARDSNGSFIFAGFKKMKKNWSILCLELKAIEEGLRSFLVNFGNPLPRILVESDSANAIAILNHDSDVYSESRTVADDVEVAAEMIGRVSYRFSRRDSNIEAHLLARQGLVHESVGGSNSGFLDSSNSEEEFVCMALMPPG